MAHRVTLIPGDGIGPEASNAVVSLLDRCGIKLEWERHDAGVSALQRVGVPLPQHVLDAVARNSVSLKDPIATPIGEGFAGVNVDLQRQLDLSADLRPVFSLPGTSTAASRASI